MSSNEESSNQAKIAQSNKKRKQLQDVFIAYGMDEQMRNKVQKKEKKLLKQQSQQSQQSQQAQQQDTPKAKVAEQDLVYIEGLDVSVGSHIKNAAVQHHAIYQQLEPQNQAIRQWAHLKKMLPPTPMTIADHDEHVDAINTIPNVFQLKQPPIKIWKIMYKEVIRLQQTYNAELDDSFRDVAFGIYFYNSLLLLIKHHAYMFDPKIDTSEWDYIVKFWGPMMENLFTNSGLRLKWGDTMLTMSDMGIDGNLKVDMRVMNDTYVQRDNQETDIATAEAAKHNPEQSKFSSDRCKLFTESKVVIDNFLEASHDVNTLYSIQFCGMKSI
ncbi:hypothetical protein MBANPS3_008582 [Mucor bainieri]